MTAQQWLSIIIVAQCVISLMLVIALRRQRNLIVLLHTRLNSIARRLEASEPTPEEVTYVHRSASGWLSAKTRDPS